MFRVLAFASVGLISHAAVALTPDEEAALEAFRDRQQSAALVHDGPDRQSRMMGPTTPPGNCLSGPVRSLQPPADASIATMSAPVGGGTSSLKLSFWRMACADDASRSAVLVRYSDIVGTFPFCGNFFGVIQNGVTYRSVIIMTGPGGYSCGSGIAFSETFAMGQFANHHQFDSQLEFKVYYSSPNGPSSIATVPAYSGASSSVGTSEPGPLYLGWWYNAGQTGRGWGIGRSGDRLFLGGFLYDTAGDPDWVISNLGLVSSSSVDVDGLKATNAVYKGDLIYCRNGQSFEMATGKTPDCAGRGSVQLEAFGARAAKLTITRTDTGATLVSNIVPFDNF